MSVSIKIVIFLFYIVANLSTSAQQLEWVRSVGGNGGVLAKEIVSDEFGNIYVGVESSGIGDYDLLTSEGSFNADSSSHAGLIAYSTDNEFLWGITLDATGFSRTYGLDFQSDNSLIWSGRYLGDMTLVSTDSIYTFESEWENAFLIKLDAEGEILWARTTLGRCQSEGVLVDADDNIFIHGAGVDPAFMDINDEYVTFNTIPPIDNGIPYDGYIAKLDADGKLLWARTVGGTGVEEIRKTELMSNGDIVLSGRYSGNPEFNSSIDLDFGSGEALADYSGYPNTFWMRIDAEGEPVWIRHSQFIDEQFWTYMRVEDIVVDEQDNIFICANHRGAVELFAGSGVILDGDTLGAPPLTDYLEIFLARIAPDGSLDWAFELENYAPEEDLQWDLSSRLYIGPANNILMTGRFAGFTDFDPVASMGEVNGQGMADGFIASYSTDGAFLGVNTLGGGENDAIYLWHQDTSGNEFLLGNHGTDQIFNYEGLSIALDTVGPGRENIIIKLGETVGLNEKVSETEFNLYPSPASDRLSLSFDQINEASELFIIDARGEVVQRLVLAPAHEYQIDISELASGAYMLNIGGSSKSFIKQ